MRWRNENYNNDISWKAGEDKEIRKGVKIIKKQEREKIQNIFCLARFTLSSKTESKKFIILVLF